MINYLSTSGDLTRHTCRQAVLQGLAADGGLYMPDSFPVLSPYFFERLSGYSLKRIAFEVLKPFTEECVSTERLKHIVDDAFSFPVPLVQIADNTYSLELFHGPTLAFKDFGARFMGRLLAHFAKTLEKEITVLVATSGDTGSAVAAGFYNVLGIHVVILYPKGKVSHMQEQQLTTWRGNVSALEIDGTFDDCQALVKQAFSDSELREKLTLTSANSINIARLLPQMVYYFYAVSQLQTKELPVIFSVPSGNLGNLTGGLFAKKLGLPVEKFIAATNNNEVFPKYLSTGIFKPNKSIVTLANAMDVGNPSNFARIQYLYHNSVRKMRKDIWTTSVSDEDIKTAIKSVNAEKNYLLDPHGAVGYVGVERYKEENNDSASYVFLETAHPAKFQPVVEEITEEKLEVPEELEKFMHKDKNASNLSISLQELKRYLLFS